MDNIVNVTAASAITTTTLPNSPSLIELSSEMLQLEFQVGSEIENTVNYTTVIENLSSILPLYTRIISAVIIIIILIVGTVGNTMVTMVICCSRDMRTSTNFFLVNLSVADLLVILIITPTALLEVLYHPEIWLFGPTMCKLVPALELTVCHASVLTILAISFERYYAICSPLQANYVCTRARAVYICAIVWISAALITSPILFMTSYMEGRNANGEIEAACIVEAGSLWPDLYTISTIVLFFLLPFAILLITYWMIAQRLTMDQSELTVKNENYRGRRQVVLMLGTVVLIFFLCLLPFRLLTLTVLITDDPTEFIGTHQEAYYNILYFCRIMSYINSAINPILYNIMSTKFRNGFRRLCGRRGKQFIFHRNGTFLTLTTTTTSINLPLNINNNNTPTTISTSTSTSPELVGSQVGIVRKNGIMRKSEGQHQHQHRHSSLYRTRHHHQHRTSTSGKTGTRVNWSTCQQSIVSPTLLLPTQVNSSGKGQIIGCSSSGNGPKKSILYSSFGGGGCGSSSSSRRNESML